MEVAAAFSVSDWERVERVSVAQAELVGKCVVIKQVKKFKRLVLYRRREGGT